MTSPTPTLPGNSACPRCGAGFHCGMVARSNSPVADAAPGAAGPAVDCWCLQRPRGLPVPSVPSVPKAPLPEAPLPAHDQPAAASCFCPTCLEQITHERQPRLSAAPD